MRSSCTSTLTIFQIILGVSTPPNPCQLFGQTAEQSRHCTVYVRKICPLEPASTRRFPSASSVCMCVVFFLFSRNRVRLMRNSTIVKLLTKFIVETNRTSLCRSDTKLEHLVRFCFLEVSTQTPVSMFHHHVAADTREEGLGLGNLKKRKNRKKHKKRENETKKSMITRRMGKYNKIVKKETKKMINESKK